MADIVIQDTSVSTEYVRSEWTVDFVEGGYSPPSAYDVVYYFGTIKTVKDSVSATDESKSGWLVEFLEEGYESPSFQSIEFYFGTIKPVKDFGSGSDDASIAARTVKDFIDYVTYVYVYTEGVIDVEAEVFDSSDPAVSSVTPPSAILTVSDECTTSDLAFQAFYVEETSSTISSVQSSAVTKVGDSGQVSESSTTHNSLIISDAANSEETLAKPSIKYINFENSGYFSPDPFEIIFEFLEGEHVTIYDSGQVAESVYYENWSKFVYDSASSAESLLKFDGLLVTIREYPVGSDATAVNVSNILQEDCVGTDDEKVRNLVSDSADSDDITSYVETSLTMSDSAEGSDTASKLSVAIAEWASSSEVVARVVKDDFTATDAANKYVLIQETSIGSEVANRKVLVSDLADGQDLYNIWHIFDFEFIGYESPDPKDIRFDFEIHKKILIEENFVGLDVAARKVFDSASSQGELNVTNSLATIDTASISEQFQVASVLSVDDFVTGVMEIGALIFLVQDSGQGSDERYEEISSTDFDFKESEYTAPSSTSLEFNFHDYDKAIQITVDTTAVDVGIVSEDFLIEAIPPTVSDSLDTTTSSVTITAISTIQDDGTLSDERPVKVVRDTAYAVEWPSQSWFQSDVAYSDEVVARVITDLCEGSDKLGQKVEVSDSCIASEFFTVQSTVIDSDVSTTASEILVETYTLVSDSSETAQDAVSKFRTVYDSAVGEDVPNKTSIVQDSSQADERLVEVIPDVSQTQEIPVRVIKDYADGSGVPDRYSFITDSSQADERIVEVIPETIYYDEVIARIVQDSAEGADYPGKGFLVRDEAFADSRIVKVLQEQIHYSENLIEVIPDECTSLDVANRSVLVRDVGRVRRTNEKLVRIIPDQVIADDSHDPEIVINVFDQFTATDNFSLDFSNIVIQDECDGTENLIKVLFEELEGSDQFAIEFDDIKISDRSRNANDRAYVSQDLIITDSFGEITSELRRYILISEQIVTDEQIILEPIDSLVADSQWRIWGDVNVQANVWIKDEAYGDETDVETTVNIFVYDLAESSPAMLYPNILVYVEDDIPEDSISELVNKYQAYDQSVADDKIIRVVFDEGHVFDDLFQGFIVKDVCNVTINFIFRNEINIFDTGVVEEDIVRVITDECKAEETNTTPNQLPNDYLVTVGDVCVTWAWDVACSVEKSFYGDDGYTNTVHYTVHDLVFEHNPSSQKNISHIVIDRTDDRAGMTTPVEYTRAFRKPDHLFDRDTYGIIFGYDSNDKFVKLDQTYHYNNFHGNCSHSFYYNRSLTYAVPYSTGEGIAWSPVVLTNNIGYHDTDVTVYTKVSDSGHGEDLVVRVVIDDTQFDVVESVSTERSVISLDINVNVHEKPIQTQYIIIYDSGEGSDVAARVMSDSATASVSNLDIEAYLKLQSSCEGETRLLRDPGFYSGDLIVTLVDDNFLRKDYQLIDFLHDDKGFVLVKDSVNSKETISRYKFEVVPTDRTHPLTGDLVNKLVVHVNDRISTADFLTEEVSSEEVIHKDIVLTDQASGSDVLWMIEVVRSVWDMAVSWVWKRNWGDTTRDPWFSVQDPYNVIPGYDEENKFITNYTYKTESGYTRNFPYKPFYDVISLHKGSAVSDDIPAPLEVLQVNSNVEFSVVVVVSDSILATSETIQSNVSNEFSVVDRNVDFAWTDDSIELDAKVVVADQAEGNELVSNSVQPFYVIDGCVALANIGYYLHPDKKVEDSNSQWGTGKESIKLT